MWRLREITGGYNTEDVTQGVVRMSITWTKHQPTLTFSTSSASPNLAAGRRRSSFRSGRQQLFSLSV
ncbi:hypothetical protein LWI29_007985 [Acer saccharum]|uniref:Uncharacterized protein n=1 Tax=Acer saccharum TaxID=4024 RepID=A0AA39TJK6_ACESA|nr:hypothetical protein LWI29_007985 [Acer saccharum]